MHVHTYIHTYMYVCMYVCIYMYVYAYIHIVYIIKAVFAACRRLEQRHEAPTEREAPEVILRCTA